MLVRTRPGVQAEPAVDSRPPRSHNRGDGPHHPGTPMTPHPHAATDRRILETLKAVHNRGAGLYNAGAHAEAFRLYQGALAVARAFLDHRPAVRRLIDDGLAEVEAVDGNARLRAFR